jgi:hypothetical protein
VKAAFIKVGSVPTIIFDLKPTKINIKLKNKTEYDNCDVSLALKI